MSVTLRYILLQTSILTTHHSRFYEFETNLLAVTLYLVSSQANWFDANIFCRDHGMQLATVNSDLERNAIGELLQQLKVTDFYGMELYCTFHSST